MCHLCERSWLGMLNYKWGSKHIDFDYTRHYGTWTTHYNTYHDPYMKRFKRNIGFEPKDLKRNNW